MKKTNIELNMAHIQYIQKDYEVKKLILDYDNDKWGILFVAYGEVCAEMANAYGDVANYSDITMEEFLDCYDSI